MFQKELTVEQQDHRQEARNAFDRIMRVPDAIAVAMMIALLGIPLLMALDLLTVERPRWHNEVTFLTWLMVALGVFLPARFLLRVVAAAIIAAIAVRRTKAAAAGRPAGTPAEPERSVRQLAAGD